MMYKLAELCAFKAWSMDKNSSHRIMREHLIPRLKCRITTSIDDNTYYCVRGKIVYMAKLSFTTLTLTICRLKDRELIQDHCYILKDESFIYFQELYDVFDRNILYRSGGRLMLYDMCSEGILIYVTRTSIKDNQYMFNSKGEVIVRPQSINKNIIFYAAPGIKYHVPYGDIVNGYIIMSGPSLNILYDFKLLSKVSSTQA